jgi:glycosyltransferase involved in cell wall biosynthesis
VAREAAFARVPRVATTSVGLDDDEAFVVESESERALEAAIDLALERPEITRAKVELAAERAAPFAWEAMAGTIDARLHDAWR